MGVKGLQTFVTENGILVPHRLQHTALRIDGPSLQNELYSAFFKSHDDKAYGGDYTHLTLYIEDFFRGLLECSVQPILIMGGSFEADKLEKVKEQFNGSLHCALNIYRGHGAMEVESLLNPYVFVQIAKRLGIRVNKSIFEADGRIQQIGTNIGAPILSGDSDFFLESHPEGVINPKTLLSPNLTVQTNFGSGQKYIACQIYKFENLQKKFPGLKPELVRLCGAILGNDSLSFEETKRVLGKLPRSPVRLSTFRQSQIYQVFSWLSSQPSTVSALASLIQICGTKQHPLIRGIDDHYLKAIQAFDIKQLLSMGEYFAEYRAQLFSRAPGVPEWAHEALIEERLPRRLISILHGKVDFFQPLVEDFSLARSSSETVFELCTVIYGLIQGDDSNSKKVTRFYRQGYGLQEETVQPTVQIANKRLPTFNEIGSLSQAERITLFYEILDISPSIQREIKSLLPSGLSGSISDQLMTLLLSLIYLCRHYSYDLWLEYFYAQIVNILFMGHFTDDDRLPAVLELNDDEHKKLFSSLKVFDVLPSRAENYKARIVHQYNAFQNCLHNILFLAQVLDLADVFHADHLVSGLQGTFIYNLTIDLASRDKPLLHLEKTLFGGLSFKNLYLFQTVLEFLLKFRKFVDTYFFAGTEGILPVNCKVNQFAITKEDRLFVRGLSDSPGGHANVEEWKRNSMERFRKLANWAVKLPCY